MSYDRDLLAVNPEIYDWNTVEAKAEARLRLHAHALEWRDNLLGSVNDWLTVITDTDAVKVLGEHEVQCFMYVVFFFNHHS